MELKCVCPSFTVLVCVSLVWQLNGDDSYVNSPSSPHLLPISPPPMSIGRARGASGSAGKVASSCSSRPWGARQGIDLLSSDQQSLCQYTVMQRRYTYKHFVAKKMSVCQRPRIGFCPVQPQLKIVRLMSTGRFRHARRCDLSLKIFSCPNEIFSSNPNPEA